MSEVKARITIPISDFESLTPEEVLDRVVKDIIMRHKLGNLAECLELETADGVKPANAIVHMQAEIERVSNGVVVSGHDPSSPKTKIYFGSIKEFMDTWLIGDIGQAEADMRRNSTGGDKYTFTATLQAKCGGDES